MNMHTRVHRGIGGLNSLRSQWVALHGFCDLWARFEWYYAYLTNLVVDRESVYFIQILAGDETVAIIPAEVVKQNLKPFGNLKVLCLAFHSHIAITDFPLDPRVDPASVAEQLLKTLRNIPECWDLIRWPRIMHSSNALLISRALRGHSIHIRPAEPCNTIDTNKSFQDLASNFSNQLQRRLKKSRRLLSEIANLCVATARSAEDSGASYEEFLRIEASGWKGDSGTASAILLNKAPRGFYAALLDQKNTDFLPEIYLLESGLQSIAVQFSIGTRGCKHVLKIGYEESYSKMSPGQILMEDVLMSACRTTSTERVSLVSNQPWHQQWQPKPEDTFDVMIFRNRLHGVIFGWCIALRKLAKSFVKKVKSTPTN
ncbi:MAG: GNAT family N-acetyltransferase [Planctomycetota bacterium]